MAAFEMGVMTPASGNLIRENKTFRMNSSIQTGTKHGMQLLDDALFKLWQEETCEKVDVLSKANDSADLAQRISNAERGIFEEEEEIVN